MSSTVKKYAWVLALTLAPELAAQVKVEIPAPKAKGTVESAQSTTGPVGKNLPDASGLPKQKSGDQSPQTNSDTASHEATASSERKAEPSLGAAATPAVRRDPFRPFTLNARVTVRRRENLSPLERFELGQLKVVGIVWDIKSPAAMIEDATGLGYIVRLGTPIGSNDGKVKIISPDGITVEESYVDLYGVKKTREVSLRLVVEKSE